MTPEQRAATAEAIRRLVDTAPPLSAEQRARLRPVLAPLRQALARRKAA